MSHHAWRIREGDAVNKTHHKTRQVHLLRIVAEAAAAEAEEMVISEGFGAEQEAADILVVELATAWPAFDLQA